MYTAWFLWTFNTFIVLLGSDDLSANMNTYQFKKLEGCTNCDAKNAVDRNLNTCTKTDMGNTSIAKNTWWYVDLGNVQSVYNIRIQFKDYEQYTMRQKGRFAGFLLYVSNTTDRPSGHLCYKDGPELPPLDFNTNCITHGRYVIFFNERMVGINYPLEYETVNVVTELCEVTVTGCAKSGVYGFKCDIPCPENCQKRRCNIINGTCLGCTPGWMGKNCTTECLPGYYGLECKSNCFGHCKDNKPCNNTNGLCDNGCYDGWTGENCTEECPTGTFGSDCMYNCSKHCSGNGTCDGDSGKCHKGCKPGYTGDLCDKECPTDAFGPDCASNCSGHCFDDITCNRTTGRCDTGCKPGYTGEFCDTACYKGSYGPNCMHNCSPNCTGGLCNNVDGSCICAYGENGPPLCNDANLQSSVFENTCNESFYITGLSIMIIISILLGIACLFFLRKYRRLVKQVRSLQYASITKISQQQKENAKDDQQYEELRISGVSYHNIELKN